MGKERVSIDFRMKDIDGARNYLLKETKHNYLMSDKHKKSAQGFELL